MDFHTLYTNFFWLLAYIYGYLQPFFAYLSKATKETKLTIYNYFTDNKKTNVSNTISIYMTDGEKMLPFSFDTSTLHKHHLLFYVVVKIDETHNKVIVFNSLDKLIFLFNNLQDYVKNKMPKFSKFLDVRITNNTTVDHIDTFIEYTDKTDTYYSDISCYNIRARDIYDFMNNNFLLSRGDRLNVIKMDLSSHEYHYEEQL